MALPWNWGSQATKDWSAQVIASSASATGTSNSNDNKIGTEHTFKITYGSGASQGVTIYVLPTYDGTTYQTTSDNNYRFEAPYVDNGTAYTQVFVPPTYPDYKIAIDNASGASATIWHKARTATTS